jgi:hypothetical protein
VPGGTTVTALGGRSFCGGLLAHLGGDLGDQFVGRHADRAGQAEFVVDALLQAARDSLRVFAQVADIHESLVNRDLLDQRREIAQALHDLFGHFAVIAAVMRDDQQARAEPQRPAHRHGRTDPKAAGGVGAGGHHAAFVRPAAHREGLAAQGRVVQFFDGAEEGIQVEVQDGARHMEIIYHRSARRRRSQNSKALRRSIRYSNWQ